MKLLKSAAALCILGSLYLFCVSCQSAGTPAETDTDPNVSAALESGETKVPPSAEINDSEGSEPAGEFLYTERTGQTAVLLQDTELTDGFTYTYSDADDYLTYQWLDLDEPPAVRSGDIVLVLAEEDGKCRVAVPGDIPWVYGYVSSGLISTDPADIEQGNLAMVDQCDAYDSVDGSVTETISSTMVSIETREGDWACVWGFDGAGPWWVQASSLSFDFSDTVLDIAE